MNLPHLANCHKIHLIVEYGWLDTSTLPAFPVVPAIVKGFRIQGFHLSFHLVAHPERLAAGIEYVDRRVQSGAFVPSIADRQFTLDRIVEAYQYMESNEQLRKIVVTVRLSLFFKITAQN